MSPTVRLASDAWCRISCLERSIAPKTSQSCNRVVVTISSRCIRWARVMSARTAM
jgi:hypothetical protein